MTENEAAELFLATGFVWLNKRDEAVNVRIAQISKDTAQQLKERFGGSVSTWAATGSHQWEAGGKPARLFLIAVAPWVSLTPHRRETPTT